MMTRAYAVGLTLVLVGCHELTSAATPDVVQGSQFDNPQGALVQRAGAINDFAESYAEQVVFSGLISDELSDRTGGTYVADQRRLLTFPNPNFPYDTLSMARVQALRAAVSLEQFAPTPAWRIGEMFAYVGFAETMLAEDMCSGTPIADISNGIPVPGPTLSRNALLARAITDFDSAAAHAKGTDSIGTMAVIGIARALLDSGDFAGAAAVAATVPVDYQFAVQYGASTQLNLVNFTFFAELVATVSDREGINGLDFVSAQDPRLPLTVAGVSPFLPNDTILAPVSQSSPTAPVTLATGTEAQLIQAEAELPIHGGVGTTWLNTLNALRANVPGLAPLTDPGTDSARVSLLFRERAFWLFLTGHRQSDLRRLIRQYGRATESVFPTGPYYAGGVYGSAVAFEPFEEFANPNYHGCFSTGA